MHQTHRDNPATDSRLSGSSFAFKRWDLSQLPIEGLSLSRLCDRESPVLYWAPRREEIERIAGVAAALHRGPGLPIVLEVGCGSGLLSYLLASTGKVRVVASDPDSGLIEWSPYRHPNLTSLAASAEEAAASFRESGVTCVINSWMPPGVNLTPAIRSIGADAIVYVRERIGETGVPESAARRLSFRFGGDLEDHISYRPGSSYLRALHWRGPAHWEIVEHFRGYTYSECITDSNVVEVQLRRDRAELLPATRDAICAINNRGLPRYAWEADLEKFKGPHAGSIFLFEEGVDP